jgi:hypothetical protein
MSYVHNDANAQAIRMLTERNVQLANQLTAAHRELERHRHGNTIEGDDVCPDSLALTAARSDLTRLTRERDEARAELIQVNRVFESIAGEADDLEDALIHSNAMSAGWKRLAKETRRDNRTDEQLKAGTRTATIRECAERVRRACGSTGATAEILSLLPDAERGEP